MNPATHRELATLALAADKILTGDLEAALEILLQRFKAVESVASGVLAPIVAANLEVIPDTRVSSLSLSERTEAVALNGRWRKMQPAVEDRKPSPARSAPGTPS